MEEIMEKIIVPGIIGLMVIVMGVINMTGNISTLHWYHRSHVKEEDRLPFGRMVGLGTVIVGCALIINACLEYAALKTGNGSLDFYGGLVLIAGLIAGFVIIVIALFRYNKGIF